MGKCLRDLYRGLYGERDLRRVSSCDFGIA